MEGLNITTTNEKKLTIKNTEKSDQMKTLWNRFSDDEVLNNALPKKTAQENYTTLAKRSDQKDSVGHSKTHEDSQLNKKRRIHHSKRHLSNNVAIGTDISLELQNRFPDYIQEIERITKTKIGTEQRKLLMDYIDYNRVAKLDSQKIASKRQEFCLARQDLREQWELKTGQEWPRYNKDILEKGTIVRYAGNFYDTHHIVELNYNGPNKWWNMHPASYREHQKGIHGKRSVATKLFEGKQR